MNQPMRWPMMLRWGRNPLRRRTDRLEASMIGGLIVVFLIAAPVLVAVVIHWTRAAGLRQERAEMAWRQVAATVTHSAAGPHDSLVPSAPIWTPAHWTAPDGQPRSGRIPVGPHAAAGSTARVWVTPSGALTGWPLRRAQLQGRTVIFGALAAVMLGLMLGLAGSAGRFLFRRRRLADWDKEWRSVGPRWTRRL